MALTLTEAAKLSQDVLLEGVLESVIYQDDLLYTLPWIEVVGNALAYRKENAAPTVSHYDVGDTWTEDTPTFTEDSATLRIVGGDADVDNYLKGTRHNIQDLEAAIIKLKVKALLDTIGEKLIYGDNTTTPQEPDGLRQLIGYDAAGAQVITMGATGAALTLAKVDELIDLVQGGPPHCLLMSKRSRRKIVGLARAAGTNLVIGAGKLGETLYYWGETIPVLISDHILNTHTLVGSAETALTGASSSTIYALRFGEGAIAGIMGPGGIQLDRIGALETKDADRNRVKLYYALASFNTIRSSALIGVTD